MGRTILDMTMTPHRARANGVSDRRSTSTGVPNVSMALQFDDSDSHADVLDALILEKFVDGSRPRARTKRLDQVRDEATLLPPGVRPSHTAIGDGTEAKLASGDGWTLRGCAVAQRRRVVSVTAVSDELAESIGRPGRGRRGR